MLYMILEHFKGNPEAVYRRFREQGRLAPEGLRYVNSWVTADLQRCYQLMECDDPGLLQLWIDRWKDLVDFEVVPVMASSEAVAAMSSEDNPSEIVWRLHLMAPRQRVFDLLSTDQGRASFWAQRTEQEGDEILFHFINGETLRSRVLESTPIERFSLTYFNGSVVTFELRDAGPGTDLLLRESGNQIEENRAGWVSVLLNLKARADHGIDLRNHDPQRTWSEGYVDN